MNYYYLKDRFQNFVRLTQDKGWGYIKDLGEWKSAETHWIALYANCHNETNFDSFGVEYILKEIRKFMGNKNNTVGIYRIQAKDSIMSGYFCIGFINIMLNGKSLFSIYFLLGNIMWRIIFSKTENWKITQQHHNTVQTLSQFRLYLVCIWGSRV